MRLIDRQFLRTPFYGSRRLTASLKRSGETVSRQRVQRLMALMGRDAIVPKPRTTAAAPDARVYPYWLRDRVLTPVNEVWSSDITYILMRHGVMYLTAVIDGFSRCVLSWRLSNTREGPFSWRSSTRRCRGAGPRSSTPTRVRSSRRGIPPAAGGGRDRDEPGRSWACVGQRVRGATVEEREIRRHIH